MLANFWRFSHFLLAVFASGFLIVAALTGIILAMEPISDYVKSSADVKTNDTLTLAEVIPQLQEKYLEVFSIERERFGAIKVDVIGMNENADGEFYIQPTTGEKVAEIQKQKTIYSWSTTLHRSLFLHQTGRIVMGIAVFFLLLMTLSGLALVLKQTQGLKKIFSRIKKQNQSQYNHLILGRISFVFLLLMALGGTIMFLHTQFHFKDKETQNFPLDKKQKILSIEDFPVFKEVTLSEIKRVDFPFSSEEDDYFLLELTNKRLEIHQYSGEIVSQQDLTLLQETYNWAEILHTGRGSIVWSIVLALLAVNILYFIYSGTKISWRRISSKTGNKYKAQDAEIVILIGSENGSTRNFGALLFKALLKAKHKVFIDDMNNYQRYEKANHLLLFTSTYGEGEAPFNAQSFLKKVETIKQKNILQTYIVGFGSMSYTHFCKYAVDVYNSLKDHSNFKLLAVPPLIHNQSFTSYTAALDNWKKNSQLKFQLPEEKRKEVPLVEFEIVQKEIVEDGYTETFTLEIRNLDKTKYQSGDLLAIVPQKESAERYYSIGKLANGNSILSIKRHDLGVCSNYLFQLEKGDVFSGRIKSNPSFHFPKKRDVLCIGNGTGIAPFIGMHPRSATQKVYYLLGGRNEKSFALYQRPLLTEIVSQNIVQFAYSKIDRTEKYVQDVVRKNPQLITEILKNKGTIMICGSVKMRDGVLQEIKTILAKEQLEGLENFIEKKQILMDCY